MNIKMVHHRTNAPIKPTPLVGPWKCNVCNAKFTDIRAHVQHMGSHALEYPSSCPLCLARFKTAAQLGDHVCIANNKSSRACNTSNNVNINNNNNNNINQNNSAISEKTQKGWELEETSAVAEILTQANNQLNRIIAIAGSSSAQLSPSATAYDDGPDEEDAFETAQNPIKRTRSCSTEVGKDKYLVTDPLHACSALIYADGDEMVVGSHHRTAPEEMAGRDESGRPKPVSPDMVDDLINELIQPIIPMPPLTQRPIARARPAGGPRNTAARAPMLQRRQSRNAETTPGSNNLRNSSPSGIMASQIPATSTSASSVPCSAPVNATMTLDTLHNIADREELHPATASHRGIASQPDELCLSTESTSESELSPNSPYYQHLQCIKCNLRFFDKGSWDKHAKTRHIPFTKAVIILDKVSVIDVDAERLPNRVKDDDKGLPSPRPSSSTVTEPTDRSKGSPSDQNEAGEQKKGVLKLTLCRSAGKYILKRSSTDNSAGENSTGSSPTGQNNSPPSRRLSSSSVGDAAATTSSPIDPGHALNEEISGANGGDTGGEQISLSTPSTSTDNRSANVDNSTRNEPGLKKLADCIKQVKRKIYPKSQACQEKSQEMSNDPRDDSRQATGEPGKSSMTSPTTSEKSPPSTSSNNNKEKEQEQIVPSTVSKLEGVVSQRDAARTSPSTVPQAQTKEVSEGESQDSSQARVEAETRRPSVQRVVDLIRHTSAFTGEMTVESEPVRDSDLISAQKRLRLSGGSSSGGEGEAILPGDLEKSPCSERDNPVADVNDDDNDNDALVIDTRTEEEREADEADRRNDRVEGQDEGENVQKEGSSTQSNRDEAVTSPPTGGNDEGNNNQEDGNEDFRCQVCHELFLTEKEVNSHFSAAHFRPVGESILEPESPYPTGNADGSMDDDMDVPETMPVETQLIEYPETTLSTLLRRDSNGETAAHSSHSLGHGGVPSQVILPVRQPFQPTGRGYPPPRMSPPFAIQAEHRPMGPPVSQPGTLRPSEFPSALHRALIDQAHGQYRGQAPPPQLRPMPMSQMRGVGVPSQHLQNRPPLTRVPSATQMSQNMPTRNPNSILRPLGPPLQRPPMEEQLNNARSKMKSVDEELRKVNLQAFQESNPELRQNLVARKDELIRIYQQLSTQIVGYQQQQRQEILRRQQMHQLDAQSLQQQQMRQHQLQQSTNRPSTSTDNAAVHQRQAELINANGKRPGGSIMDAAGMPHDPKQPRFDPHFSIQRSMQLHENLQRMQNGMTSRPLPPAGSPSPAQIVKPGMNSGGSNGSRHSSGSTSPAIPSPVAQRLAHSGITLTATSPSLPLTPLSPPANPNHSPISDTSLSPRGSPRIQVGHLVQNVMNTCGVPASSAISPGSAAQPSNNFAQPKPLPIPYRANNDGMVGRNPIVTISHADRPDRPPTVDLTDDDIQTHNAQMRATGRGIITEEQIRFHEAILQQRRGLSSIPGTSQFTIRPVSNSQGPSPQASPNPQPSPPFNTSNEHGGVMTQRQVTVQPQATFRPPHPQHQQQQQHLQRQQQQQQQQHQGVVIRQTPPITLPHIRSNIATLAQGMPSQRPQMPMRAPNPTTVGRQHNQPQSSPLSADAYQKLVIPLLYLDRLDQNKIRALNDIGVTSFIPLDRAANLGIPLLRLRPDVALGHFPHDTAVEIGPARPLPTPDQARQQQAQRTPPTNIPVPSHAAAQPSRPHPQSVMSPPMGTVCNDRSCTEMMQQRPSPTSVIQRSMTHAPNQVLVRQIHPQQPMNANANQYQQQQQRSSHHESFLGGSGGQFGGNRN